jgi:hypothetical protein
MEACVRKTLEGSAQAVEICSGSLPETPKFNSRLAQNGMGRGGLACSNLDRTWRHPAAFGAISAVRRESDDPDPDVD